MSEHDFDSHMRRSVVSNFVINLLINGGLALWLLGGHASLSPWSDPAYGPDLLITGFLLCAIVAAIVMEVSRRQARRGELPVVPERWKSMSANSSRSRWALCVAAGLAGTALSLVVALGCTALVASMSVPAYAGVKAVWAGMLAAVVVVPATVLGAARGAAERVSA